MTIHSDWPRVLREECPEAFAMRPPRAAMNVGFVDGHLQLMQLHPCIGSWTNFVRCQFIKPLQMLLERGCPRVVLCFDCYDNVPEYKNMTQTRRSSSHNARPFYPGNPWISPKLYPWLPPKLYPWLSLKLYP